MPYAILRFQKKKAGAVAACERHNERKKGAYKSNPDIDMERSKDNYHILPPPPRTYKQEINRRVKAAGCKVRRDSVMMVETLITASPEFMKSLPEAEQREYFKRAFDFIAERIGRDNIISAIVHMDEKTPHLHLTFVPITEDRRLSAKSFLGNQKTLSKWQTDFHERMSERWTELERGQSSMETKRKHIPTWLFKLAGRLDKQHDEILKALEDINAFNAGKKRNEAVELLKAWILEVDRFINEVRKISGYLDRTKGSEAIARENTAYWKKEAESKDLELFKAHAAIRQLEHTAKKQKKILDKIPSDVLKEVQAAERERRGR